MIHNLCNVVDQFNFDNFYKATIIEASQLPQFNHLDKDSTILEIVNSIPVEYQAMVIKFIPRRWNMRHDTRIVNGNKVYRSSFSLPLVPQDANIQNLLETYNNKQVIAFISRNTHSHLYGTSAQPMIFTYDDLYTTDPTGLKGYNLNMSGDSYGAAKMFAGKESDFPVINRGLAFQLAGSL